MWSLYTEMGDRDTSLEGEELHNNSPIFTNLQKIEINVYGILISDVQIWVQSLYICNVLFRSIQKKEASIDYVKV